MPHPKIRRIGMVGQSRYPGLPDAVRRVREFADRHKLEVSAEFELGGGAGGFDPEDIDLLVTLGGDGTLLRGARMVAAARIPVLGVNFGYLGFLTSIAPADLEAALERVLAGDYWLDERFMLEVVVENADGHRAAAYHALNDAVLHKGGFARVIRLAVSIGPGREEVGSYTADGIILSTPTG